MHPIPPVIVGYDGSPVAARAVRFAAEESARRRCPLGIVHVREDMTSAGASPQQLATVRTVVRGALDDHDVVVVELTGDPVVELLRESADAELLVVGRGRMDRLIDALGSVSQGVIARSSCPVVVIASSENAASSPPAERRTVVAGVKHLDRAQEILEPAFAAAQLRGGALEIVHCRRSGHSDVRSTEEAFDRLSSATAMLSAKYPDVEVAIALPHGSPADALAVAGELAGLIVIGVPRFGPIRGTLLGSAGQALLGDDGCPVMFVPRMDRVRRFGGRL